MGVFPYSREEGTEAYDMEGQVDEEVKLQRRDKLMQIQQGISWRKNRQRVDKIYPVLIEGTSQESDLVMQGRGPFQAPEVDGVIYIGDPSLKVGTLFR